MKESTFNELEAGATIYKINTEDWTLDRWRVVNKAKHERNSALLYLCIENRDQQETYTCKAAAAAGYSANAILVITAAQAVAVLAQELRQAEELQAAAKEKATAIKRQLDADKLGNIFAGE